MMVVSELLPSEKSLSSIQHWVDDSPLDLTERKCSQSPPYSGKSFVDKRGVGTCLESSKNLQELGPWLDSYLVNQPPIRDISLRTDDKNIPADYTTTQNNNKVSSKPTMTD
mmetsp:Transcript_12513/g.29872  ORF Transcript_12513/g.29872 Transcript_12513/m.29872 type:complete len:111 (-) Transcript_12513:216-548(-)